MKTIKVAAAILVDNGKVLIAKRGYGKFEGMYEFPGGKIEESETAEETVVRELKEEMNADVIVDSFYYHAHFEYPDFILEMDCFKCHLLNEHIELLEHEDYKWIDPFENNILWIPADVQIIEEIREKGI